MLRGLSRSGLDETDIGQFVRANELTLRQFAGASLLISGATGWFGVWLLDILCSADESLGLDLHVTAVSREPSIFLSRFPAFVDDRRVRWIKSDVRDLEIKGDFSHIIHAATDNSVLNSPEASLQLFKTIVDGTARVIAAAGPECRSLLLVSSGAIYGPARSDRAKFLEQDDGGPAPFSVRSAYAEGKRASELLGAIAVDEGLPVRVARCFAFVGPHMPFDKHFAIGNFIADAVSGRPIRIKSDGRSERSYLYMSDLVGALLTILAKGQVGRAYNVGSDDPISIEELGREVDRVIKGCGVVIDGAISDPRDRYVPDTSRLRNELGWSPAIDLETAILRTAAWYRGRSAW